MMEYIKHLLISTPLEAPLQYARESVNYVHLRKHPELRYVFSEPSRISAVLERDLKPDSNCIDAGCHIGSFLSQICRICPQGKHFAVEPVAYKARWLRRKFPQVTLIQTALGNQTGEAAFETMVGKSGFSRLVVKENQANMRSETVRLSLLDNVIPQDVPIHFLKMDIEGAEYSALQGARNAINRWRPLMLFECTKKGLSHFNVSVREIYELVIGYGYEIRCPERQLKNDKPMDVSEFAAAQEYPFHALNFFATPTGRTDRS
ncbi:MAG TPA: FkbM family methyltransferase [Tepidisphaeraceae bacterium]|jgi:FkbM family methyltransferase